MAALRTSRRGCLGSAGQSPAAAPPSCSDSLSSRASLRFRTPAAGSSPLRISPGMCRASLAETGAFLPGSRFFPHPCDEISVTLPIRRQMAAFFTAMQTLKHYNDGQRNWTSCNTHAVQGFIRERAQVWGEAGSRVEDAFLRVTGNEAGYRNETGRGTPRAWCSPKSPPSSRRESVEGVREPASRGAPASPRGLRGARTGASTARRPLGPARSAEAGSTPRHHPVNGIPPGPTPP